MVKTVTARVDNDELVLGSVRVSFQRTLRIPEVGLHPLPPGLGRFPLRRVEDYPDTAPSEWLARGGVMLPVYQREAMWLNFDADEPAALQVATGKVCAVSGQTWTEELRQEPQNYVPLPEQPWLDGINAGEGFVRQFVAVPLGSGATVEEQVSGQAEHGGVQLRVVGLTADALKAWRAQQLEDRLLFAGDVVGDIVACAAPDMGLGAGGRMRQEVYTDDRDLADYDPASAARVFVHLCSAAQWTAITGELPPPSPIDREAYVRAGLPWFDYYDADAVDLPPADALAAVKPVGQLAGEQPDPSTPIAPHTIKTLKHASGIGVGDGSW